MKKQNSFKQEIDKKIETILDFFPFFVLFLASPSISNQANNIVNNISNNINNSSSS